jgi:uncharacterized repeat protein (TIGR01451 family)
MKKHTLIPAFVLAVLFTNAGIAFTAHAQTATATKPQAATSAPAQAQDNKTIKAELKQFLVRTEAGKEVLKPANEVKPGDLIEYRATYTNQGSSPVRAVVAQLPIPVGLEYQPRSASGKKEAVPYYEYRSIRWNLGQLAAGAKVEVAARARVSKGEAQK